MCEKQLTANRRNAKKSTGPVTPELRSIVNQLIQIDWELRRLSGVSAQMWDYQVTDSWTAEKDEYPLGKAGSNYAKNWGTFQRRMDSLQRNQGRLLDLLRELRANPIPVPAAETSAKVQPEAQAHLELIHSSISISNENGFVPTSPQSPTVEALFPTETRSLGSVQERVA